MKTAFRDLSPNSLEHELRPKYSDGQLLVDDIRIEPGLPAYVRMRNTLRAGCPYAVIWRLISNEGPQASRRPRRFHGQT